MFHYKQQVFEIVQQAVTVGLIHLSAGNISLRTAEGLVAITPKALPYSRMRPEDIVIIDIHGQVISSTAGHLPSSETPMHTAIYRAMPEVAGICHTHSLYAITFAMLGEDVPATNLELLACGNPIPVAPWACPGTPAAGEITVEIFRRRPDLKAILLRQHGLVTIGPTLEKAFAVAYNAEFGLQATAQARLLGQAPPLTEAQIQEIRAAYAPK